MMRSRRSAAPLSGPVDTECLDGGVNPFRDNNDPMASGSGSIMDICAVGGFNPRRTVAPSMINPPFPGVEYGREHPVRDLEILAAAR